MGVGKRGMWLSERRLHVTTSIAVACHALAVVLLARPAPPIAPPSAPGELIAPIAVELDTEGPHASPPPGAPAPSEPAGAPAAMAKARVLAAARRPTRTTVVEGSAGDDAIPAPVTGEGAGSPPVAAAPARAAPDALPPPLLPRALHAPEAVFGAPLAALEGQAGASASAQVRSTVQRVVETKGPRQGRGTIRITVEEDGSVSGVVASGTGWEAATQAIRAALAGRRLRVPKGARGLVISFAADARVTRVPPVLTGEARAEVMGINAPGWVPPPTDDEHRGFALPTPKAAVIDPLALLPIARRVVKLDFLGEQAR